MGFVDFTKLSFALSSLAQPFDQMRSIPDSLASVLSHRKNEYLCRLVLCLVHDLESHRYRPGTEYTYKFLKSQKIFVYDIMTSQLCTSHFIFNKAPVQNDKYTFTEEQILSQCQCQKDRESKLHNIYDSLETKWQVVKTLKFTCQSIDKFSSPI